MVHTPSPVPTFPVTVTSFDGVDVTVTDSSRIIAVDQYGTLGETVFALGLGENLVGRDTSTSFPAAAHSQTSHQAAIVSTQKHSTPLSF
ncbi:hypothetical protein [Hoyosella rhizosphaerae]|uniref:Uncharacterized protein n=1 Tax=Hoyosella rhizosphaerae TaxID=1755582 RepID=A0A916U0F0_9ACTN|nr:hypothetical protein GCM10011410_01700 [Hoyosella rhizosphaerae]